MTEIDEVVEEWKETGFIHRNLVRLIVEERDTRKRVSPVILVELIKHEMKGMDQLEKWRFIKELAPEIIEHTNLDQYMSSESCKEWPL